MAASTIKEPSPPPIHRRRRFAAIVAVCFVVVASALAVGIRDASADAGFSRGVANVTTNGFTHQWLGSYSTNVGVAYCIETAKGYPRAHGNVPTGDLPRARGVSAQNRYAMAYALWAYARTHDDTAAAGLATAVHGLSGDAYASQDVARMRVSHPSVRAAAAKIAREAAGRWFWVHDPDRNPWVLTTELTHLEDRDWALTITVQNHDGRPITDHRIDLDLDNVAKAAPVTKGAATDGRGRFRARLTQADQFLPIAVDVATTAPTYYSVWRGPNYPRGTVPQKIVTPNGTTYRGHLDADLPSGDVRINKVTTNPAYQSAKGTTFDVTAEPSGTPVGTLLVGPDGISNALTLPIGTYTVVETSAPAGVKIDPTPHEVTVSADQITTLALTDPVETRATLALEKRDADTDAPVAGATLEVQRDDDRDGTFETTVATVTSATEPVVLDELAAGDYLITETAPPPGYSLPKEAFQKVSLTWNTTAVVTFFDVRIPERTTTTTTPPTTTPPTTAPPRTVPPTTTTPSTSTSTTSTTSTTTTTTPATTTSDVPRAPSIPPSTTPSPVPPTPGRGGGPPSPGLPATGAATGPMVSISALLLGTGTVLLAVRRRHRRREV